MNSAMSHKAKIIWFLIFSVVILFLAFLIYYYQTGTLKLGADTNPTYSQLCIEGKINGAQSKKCFSNDESDGVSIKKENQTLNLEVGENYQMEFTLGDFRLHPTDSDGMMPVYQKCKYIMLGQWGWDFQNCGSMCTTSLVYWLFLGLDTNIYNGNFSNLSGVTQSSRSQVDDTKTLVELHESDAVTGVVLSGFASHKDKGDMSEYDPTLATQLASCGPNNNENETIKYGGQHNPGDKIVMTFTPDVEYQGNIAGYNVNGQKSSGDVYGAGIMVPVNITQSSNHDSNSDTANNNSDSSSSSDSSSRKTAIPVAESVASSTNTVSSVANNSSVVADSSTSSSNSSSTSIDANNTSSTSSTQNISSLVSTGSSIWFNLLIAGMIIIGLGYYIFREDIFKK